MTLRRWTILLIAGMTLVLIGVTIFFTTRTLTSHYATQEKIGVFLNIKRVLGAVDQQQALLESGASAWASRDDFYQAALGQDSASAAAAWQPAAFRAQGIDLLSLLDARGKVVSSGALQPDGSLDSTLPAALQSRLSPSDILLSGAAAGTTRSGLLLVNGQPMLVVVLPVLRSDHSGPPAGALLVGKSLNGELMNNIGSLLLLTISSSSIQAAGSDPGYAAALAFQPTESDPYYVSFTPDQVSGYAILSDLFGQAMLVVRVDQYPTIYNNGLVVNNYLAVSLVLSAVAFSTLLFFLIQFNVLNRISRLSREVVQIGASGDIHRRLSIPHRDELSNLAGTINTTLDALERAIFQHRESEERIRTLYSVSQQLLNQVENMATQQTICQLAIENLGMAAAWLVTPSPDGGVLLPAASAGVELTQLPEIPIYPGDGQAVHLAVKAFTSMDLQFVPLAEGGRAAPLPEGISGGSMVAAPLVTGGTVLAVLVMITKNAAPPDQEALALLRAFLTLSSVALQNAFLFQQVINGRERLQLVSRRLVEIQEEERRQIALELHDEIGQVLTSLRFSIDLLKSTPPEKIESQANLASEIANELIGRVRQISLDLRPSMLDDLGIVQTLLWFFDRYTRQTGIRVNFPPNNLGRRRFSPNQEITAYRVVQEALTNVARHAKVQEVTVRLWCTEKILGIQVEDQGVGFNVDTVLSSHNSKGLLGMGERVNYVGGGMDIVSEPGEGTSLTVELPLEGVLERRKFGR